MGGSGNSPPLTRRALVFSAPGEVEIRDEALPGPNPGEALVETLVSAVSAGTEMLAYRGQLPEGLPADEHLPSLQGSLAYPLRYGYSAVGRVAALGEGVDPDLKGRTVFSFQPHQDRFTAPAGELIVLAPEIDPDDAVFLPNMETALGLVMDGRPLAGERVAVLGQGVVGLLTAGLLARFPLESLVTFDRYPMRRRRSLEAGAHASLPAGAPPGSLAHSFDLVFELSGAPQALDAAIALAGEEGRIVAGSWYGSKPAALDLGGHFHRGRLQIISSQVSRLAPALRGRWTKARRLKFALDLVARTNPSRFVTHRFAFDEAGRAYRLLAERPDDTLQVVFDYVPRRR